MLNRVVGLAKDGWELEADLHHAELIVEQLGVNDAKAVSTPGVDVAMRSAAEDEEEEEREALAGPEATIFKGIAVRCNYLQPDRPGIQYASKEVCRMMSRPKRPHGSNSSVSVDT